MKRVIVGLTLMFSAILAFGQDSPQIGAHLASQAAADLIRSAAGSDVAFLAGGNLKSSFEKDDLASLIQFPGDEIAVVNLTGTEVKQALERSVIQYPQPNPGFLQLSGIEATFSKNAASGQRIVSVSINGSKLEDKRIYTVAMPASLARGNFGYFKVWDTSKIAKTLSNATVDSVLKGKRFNDTSPRWSAVG